MELPAEKHGQSTKLVDPPAASGPENADPAMALTVTVHQLNDPNVTVAPSEVMSDSGQVRGEIISHLEKMRRLFEWTRMDVLYGKEEMHALEVELSDADPFKRKALLLQRLTEIQIQTEVARRLFKGQTYVQE